MDESDDVAIACGWLAADPEPEPDRERDLLEDGEGVPLDESSLSLCPIPPPPLLLFSALLACTGVGDWTLMLTGC